MRRGHREARLCPLTDIMCSLLVGLVYAALHRQPEAARMCSPASLSLLNGQRPPFPRHLDWQYAASRLYWAHFTAGLKAKLYGRQGLRECSLDAPIMGTWWWLVTILHRGVVSCMDRPSFP